MASWWTSTSAIILYAILALGLVYAVFRYYKKYHYTSTTTKDLANDPLSRAIRRPLLPNQYGVKQKPTYNPSF